MLFEIAQWRMQDHDDFGPGHGHEHHHWFFAVVFLVLLIALAAAVVWLLWSSKRGPTGGSPEEILNRRLATGEITPAEYRERASLIGGTVADPPTEETQAAKKPPARKPAAKTVAAKKPPPTS